MFRKKYLNLLLVITLLTSSGVLGAMTVSAQEIQVSSSNPNYTVELSINDSNIRFREHKGEKQYNAKGVLWNTYEGECLIYGDGETDHNIVVKSGSHDIAIKNVHINNTRKNDSKMIFNREAAFGLEVDVGRVNLRLVGQNTLRSGAKRAGVEVNHYNNTLNIYGDGILNAYGNEGGAGIGGAKTHICGNVIINGGTINAYGDGGAGIGSGENVSFTDHTPKSNNNITINGGKIKAVGKNRGAGIGGGNSTVDTTSVYPIQAGSGGFITINGGEIEAIALPYEIKDGYEVIEDYPGAAGIGGGGSPSFYGRAIFGFANYTTEVIGGLNGYITINGGKVRAEGYGGIGPGQNGEKFNWAPNGQNFRADYNNAQIVLVKSEVKYE